jgi:alkanesulfonate monooxygenase SsuD/methylene tetrahydromethanopterin reductase-like flavin-dependent oxidoreductase (luciferase family)
MRKVMLLLAVLGLVGSLWGADPSVGTWKLNIAKSKSAPSTEAAVKEEMAVIREVGDQWEITFTGKRVDGSSISIKASRPKQGGVVKFLTGGSEGEQSFDTVVARGDWYHTSLRNGKQVEVIHGIVSKDGKTMRQITKGTDAQGKAYETVEVYEKQ